MNKIIITKYLYMKHHSFLAFLEITLKTLKIKWNTDLYYLDLIFKSTESSVVLQDIIIIIITLFLTVYFNSRRCRCTCPSPPIQCAQPVQQRVTYKAS